MDKLRLVYIPREDATPEGELSALAAVYAYVLECHERKEAVAKVGDDEERPEGGHTGGPPKQGTDKDGGAYLA